MYLLYWICLRQHSKIILANIIVAHFLELSLKYGLMNCFCVLHLVTVRAKGSIYLQYSSKILKHLCLFPLPQCWFGYHSGLSASKYAWLNIGEGEGTFQGGKQCEVEISWFFQKIREKRCLFQRFVTSIVAKTYFLLAFFRLYFAMVLIQI